MNKNTGDGELLKYFWPFPYPKHKPPIEVIFSNGVPQSDDPDHMVFQIPYNTFEHAIKKWAAQEANKAIIKKLESVMVKVDYTDSDTLITQKALRTHNNIQRELAQLKKEKESSDG